MSARAIIHLALHFSIPAAVAWLFYRRAWLRTWAILMATMAVDLDHLLATPIFDPNRCSIGFHPLHTWPAIFVYVLMLPAKSTRVVAIGLLIHMGLDAIDCAFML